MLNFRSAVCNMLSNCLSTPIFAESAAGPGFGSCGWLHEAALPAVSQQARVAGLCLAWQFQTIGTAVASSNDHDPWSSPGYTERGLMLVQ